MSDRQFSLSRQCISQFIPLLLALLLCLALSACDGGGTKGKEHFGGIDIPSHEYAARVVELTNEERRRAGVPRVAYDNDLERRAMIRAIEITVNFDQKPHKTLSLFESEDEIIAKGFNTPESVVDGWMASSSHRDVILTDTHGGSTGVGVYAHGDKIYWVQLFQWDFSILNYLSAPLSIQAETVQAAMSPAYFAAPPTLNQSATGNGLLGLSDTDPVYYSFLLETLSGTPGQFLDSVSGEVHSTMNGALNQLDRQYSRSLMAQAANRAFERRSPAWGNSGAGGEAGQFVTDGGSEEAGQAEPSRLWFSASGSYNSLDSGKGLGRASLHGPEFFMGYEQLFSGGWLLGVSGGLGIKEMQVKGRSSDADVLSYSLAAYGGKEIETGPGVWRLILGASYTRHQVESSRAVSLSSGNEQLSAEYHANSWQAFAETGLAIPLGQLDVEPFGNLSYRYTDFGSLSERGGSAALRADSEQRHTLDSTLGARLRGNVSDTLQFRAEAGWRHTYGNLDAQRHVNFISGNQPFTVSGNALSRDEAIFGLGLAWAATEDLSLRLDYQGAWGKQSQSHGGFLGFELGW